MSFRELVHNPTLKFDGTNYDVWKIYMLDYFWGMHPHMEQILDMGFSPPKDPQNPSFEEKKNFYLDAPYVGACPENNQACRISKHHS